MRRSGDGNKAGERARPSNQRPDTHRRATTSPIDKIHNMISKQARQPPPPHSQNPRKWIPPRPPCRVIGEGRRSEAMRRSDWASERVAGGTDDGHGAGTGRQEKSNEASTEPRRHPMPNRMDEMASRWQASELKTDATPSYRPARRVDEAGRRARRHGTARATR